MKEKLSFAGKISRLSARLKEAEWRQNGVLLGVVKMMG